MTAMSRLRGLTSQELEDAGSRLYGGDRRLVNAAVPPPFDGDLDSHELSGADLLPDLIGKRPQGPQIDPTPEVPNMALPEETDRLIKAGTSSYDAIIDHAIEGLNDHIGYCQQQVKILELKRETYRHSVIDLLKTTHTITVDINSKQELVSNLTT